MTITSTGHDAVHGLLGFRSRWPQRECASSARRDQGELSVALEMDSPITEEPRRFGFPVHCEPSIRLRGLTSVEAAEYPALLHAGPRREARRIWPQ